MRKIKCMFNHWGLRSININEVTKTKYENEQEGICVWRCKYCRSSVHVEDLFVK